MQSFLNINTLYLLVLPNKWVRHVVPYLSAERQPCFIYSGSTCGYLLHHLYVGSLFVYMSPWWKDAMISIFPVDSSSRVSCLLHSSSISKWQQSSLQSKESLFSNTLYFCYNWNIIIFHVVFTDFLYSWMILETQSFIGTIHFM